MTPFALSRRSVWFLRLVLLLVGLLSVYLRAQDPPRPAVNDDSQNHEHISNADKASDAALRAGAIAVPGSAFDVLTRSYNNLRSGANTQETRLNHQAARNGLRLDCSMVVGGDGRGFDAQPLIARNIRTQDGADHDVLIAASLGNVIAAFDANTCAPLWQRLLARPVTSTKTIDAWLTNDNFGIISTGVIVRNPEQIKTATFYAVAWTSPTGTNADGTHKLYEINLYDGRNTRAPLALTQVGTIQRKQRAALSFYAYPTPQGMQPTLFIPWGTVQETAPGAHGFLTAIDLTTWKVATEWNVTPQGKGGGIWQAGQGVVIDGEGFLYAMTSNGSYNGTTDFSESFVKLRYSLAPSALTVVDHYAPFRDDTRIAAYDDQDLGAGGPNCIPDLNLCFGAGKDGILYTMPWRRMSAPLAPLWYTFYPGPNVPATRVYDQLFYQRTHHQHGNSVVAYINEHNAGTSIPEWRAFCWGENGNLRAWKVTNTGLKFLANGEATASAQSRVPAGGMPGAFMTLSANDRNEAILWATVPLGDANREVTQGYLAAYDANNFDQYSDGTGKINQLWRSAPFTFSKFNPPVVSGGRVYVSTYDGRILVFTI